MPQPVRETLTSGRSDEFSVLRGTIWPRMCYSVLRLWLSKIALTEGWGTWRDQAGVEDDILQRSNAAQVPHRARVLRAIVDGR